MGRKGRDLELLVERIEKSFCKLGDTVTSPYYYSDVVTRQRREIDVFIESKIGSSTVRIAIECRKRSDKQDVRWIEELVTKGKDINANIVVAVSSSPFTGPAQAKARHYGIQTRTLRQLNSNEFLEWTQLEEIKMQYQLHDLRGIIVRARAGFDEVTDQAIKSVEADRESAAPFYLVAESAICQLVK